MVNEIQYTSIKRVLDDVTVHPMLRDVTLDQVIRNTIRFIGLHGYNKLYQNKIENVEIDEFRGVLPCDLVRIIQVKDLKTNICLRAMTDNFAKGMEPCPPPPPKDLNNNVNPPRELYIPAIVRYCEEPAFKTQGRIIYTSFPKGCIEVSYMAIPVDEDGYPLLIDNEVYLAALEAFIKVEVFTYKFDEGKISAGVLQNAKSDYAWYSHQLKSEMTIPSVSEFESISRSLLALIPRVRQFDNGFTNLGDREYIRRH